MHTGFERICSWVPAFLTCTDSNPFGAVFIISVVSLLICVSTFILLYKTLETYVNQNINLKDQPRFLVAKVFSVVAFFMVTFVVLFV